MLRLKLGYQAGIPDSWAAQAAARCLVSLLRRHCVRWHDDVPTQEDDILLSIPTAR